MTTHTHGDGPMEVVPFTGTLGTPVSTDVDSEAVAAMSALSQRLHECTRRYNLELAEIRAELRAAQATFQSARPCGGREG